MKQGDDTARILNVDDNEIGRYTKTRILNQAGFEVIEAANGRDALEAVRTQHPQLVLLDLQLPDVDGFEVCRRIKGDPATARLPVLHISATTLGADVEATSVESGADIFMAQPVEPPELITVVRTLLRLRTTEIGLAESEERMRLAMEGAGIVTWEVDLRSGAVQRSRHAYETLGLEPERAEDTLEPSLQHVHPEDRERIREAIERARRTGERFSQEHRVLRSDGSQRWIAAYGKVHGDEMGQPTRFMGIALDITARKYVELHREEIYRLEQEARAEAENLARLKDEFLATLSHELRSPMSAILGWLHLMRTGRLTPEQHVTAIETIERNAQLQNKLINDLLDVSRVIAGKLDLKLEPVLMHDMIEGAVESVQVSAQAKNISIVRELEAIAPMQHDVDRMQQVFVNLLSNAIKFTPENGRISVTGRPSSGMYEVAVSDTGEGVEPEVLPYLFERFRQEDGSTTRRHGGLGLGLAIVRHLVELHGGTVSAASDGKGKGATFTVRLPLAPAARGIVQVRALKPETPPAPRSTRDALRGLRVLVTDDEASARQLMSQLLASEGAEVRTASSAPEALSICAEWKPMVLVLDIGMPDVDGYTLLERMRAQPNVGDAMPAIAVTGYAQVRDRERALASGFQAHITKPYNIEEVIGEIARLGR